MFFEKRSLSEITNFVPHGNQDMQESVSSSDTIECRIAGKDFSLDDVSLGELDSSDIVKMEDGVEPMGMGEKSSSSSPLKSNPSQKLIQLDIVSESIGTDMVLI